MKNLDFDRLPVLSIPEWGVGVVFGIRLPVVGWCPVIRNYT
jgi:hypothetical protein